MKILYITILLLLQATIHAEESPIPTATPAATPYAWPYLRARDCKITNIEVTPDNIYIVFDGEWTNKPEDMGPLVKKIGLVGGNDRSEWEAQHAEILKQLRKFIGFRVDIIAPDGADCRGHHAFISPPGEWLIIRERDGKHLTFIYPLKDT